MTTFDKWTNNLNALSTIELEDLLKSAENFASLCGLLKVGPSGILTPISTTLLPSPFPRQYFQLAVRLQCNFNLLYHRIAQNHDFLASVLTPALPYDDYLSSLWRVYEQNRLQGSDQSLQLALSRSDYMLHRVANTGDLSEEWVLKQVEYNLIACSFGGLMKPMVLLHQLMVNLVDKSPVELPVCTAASVYAETLIQVHQLYMAECQRFSGPQPSAKPSRPPVILVVVSDIEANVFDQRGIEFAVLSLDASISVLRRTFSDLAPKNGRTEMDTNKRLFVDGREISVIYYRTGYAPDHFDAQAWETKLFLENTFAVKCPSIAYQLANTKLVQTALTGANVLAGFMAESEGISALRETFARQTVLRPEFGLSSDSEISAFLSDCLRQPQNYVLKPQREGGGNNIFGDDIVEKLKCIMGRPEASAFILMERLLPPTCANYIIPCSSPSLQSQLISELGIYGALISKGSKVIKNCDAGHLLRSKSVGVNEGGIATGYACLDSPYLV